MTTPTATPAEQAADLLYPGDLAWIVSDADPLDWAYDEYAEAARLIEVDAAGNGLFAFFNFDVKQIDMRWYAPGARIERRLESEGVFTFDRVWKQQQAAAVEVTPLPIV